MSYSFCLPHPVAVSAFMICRGLCACTEMFSRSRFLVYSAGSGVNRVQVVLSAFSMRSFCFVQAKTFCMYGCIYFLDALVLVCVCVHWVVVSLRCRC